MIFTRRGPPGPDPHLEGKVWVFLLGSGLALVGMAADSSILVGAAILVLFLGVFLRFFSSSSREGDDGESQGGLLDEENEKD